MYFAFIFWRITITSLQEDLKLCKDSFFQEIYTKSSVTCILPV